MACPNGILPKGVQNEDMVCNNNYTIDCTRTTGQFIVGFDADGQPICASPPTACAATTVPLCTETGNLPNSSPGAVVVLTAGDSYSETWECRDGDWFRADTNGLCACVPGTTTEQTECAEGYDGTITTTTTTTCPGSVQTTTETGNTCVCVAGTETRNLECPPNYDGTITEQRNVACNNGVPAPGDWAETGRNCVCNQRTETRDVECPEGTDGMNTETRTLSLNGESCEWSDWARQGPDQCTCTPRTDVEDRECPAGLTGTVTYSRTTTCNPPGPGDWVETGRDCACVNRQENRTVACPEGQSGTGIPQQRTVTCTGVEVTPWANTGAGDCRPAPTYRWSTTGSPYPGTRPNGNPEVGDTCPRAGERTTCYRLVGPSNYQSYSCVCGQ